MAGDQRPSGIGIGESIFVFFFKQKTAYEMSEVPNAMVLINADVAVENSSYTTGRRGVAGTVIVEKLVGSMAESGANLEQCNAFGDRINKRMTPMAVAFTSCTVPATGTPTFRLDDDE